MNISKYQKLKIEKEKKEAILLYRRGLSLRKVGNIIGKSHEWVRQQINELSPETLDKT